jgi:hypothetical protein
MLLWSGILQELLKELYLHNKWIMSRNVFNYKNTKIRIQSELKILQNKPLISFTQTPKKTEYSGII